MTRSTTRQEGTQPAKTSGDDSDWEKQRSSNHRRVNKLPTENLPNQGRHRDFDPNTRPRPEEATTSPPTPTEWEVLKTAINTLEKAFEAKKTRTGPTPPGRKMNPGTQQEPQEATMPPGTLINWEALKTAINTLEKNIEAKRTQIKPYTTREEDAYLNTQTITEGAMTST